MRQHLCALTSWKMKYCRIIQNLSLNQKSEILKEINVERHKFLDDAEAVVLLMYEANQNQNGCVPSENGPSQMDMSTSLDQ